MMKRAFLILALCATSASVASAQRPNTREGFWIGFGFGAGSAGVDCFSCTDDRTGGLSGYLRLGGTISPKFLLGVETNGWTHSQNGIDEKLGFGSVIAIWYPSATGAFFLKLGLGAMSYSASDGFDELTAKAPAGSFGLGYDIRVGKNLSLTPYLNSLATSGASFRVNGFAVAAGQEIKINLVQLGLGLHWH